ncbi:acyl-homoserine-lactone synthase [Photobacterium kishitanii]|uniref:acyl-homoserine-lactone synthase n=1 Tax=Photobacterium kishitanii TaxID=318456 RepID=UPI0004318EDD
MYTNVIKNSAIPLCKNNQLILQQNFLQFIDEHIHLHGDADFFTTLVTARIETINHLMPHQTDNLYQCITSDYAQNINGIVALDNLDLYYIEIEKQAISLFGNILCCWAEYEHYRIMQRVIKHPLTKNSMPQLVDNNKKITEVVAQIENDTRLFITSYCALPMTLSNAIALKTIECFVKKKHCYELLYFLALSTNGEYMIHYHYKHTDLFPTLVASSHL